MAKETVKIRLNSIEKIEQVLQETYDLTCKEIAEIQNEMNKLMNSTNLKDVPIDDKVKYSKAMHDFVGDKTTAIKLKVEIAKLMAEIIKHNGDVKGAVNDPGFQKATKLDLSALRGEINKIVSDDGMTYDVSDK